VAYRPSKRESPFDAFVVPQQACRVQVRVLGPTELDVRPEGRVAVLSHKQRALLAALTLHRGGGVRAETLIELLWPAEAPRTASGTLQSYVSALRRLLEPAREPRGAASVLITVDASYRLVLPDRFFDVSAFDVDVTAVHRVVADGWGPDTIPSLPAQLTAEQVVGLEGRLSRALSTWRGTPYVELGDAPDAAAERARLEDLRLVALEDRALLRMSCGQQAVVAAELESLVRAHPFRESLRAVHAVALAAAGRHTDALSALRQAREQLADELGSDPGPVLRRLELAVLRQEPLITSRVLVGSPTHVGTVRPSVPGEVPLAGRGEELARLTDLLSVADSRRPVIVSVVGEAGIGKSRLVQELVEVASARGFKVATGRCLDEDGTPPLWPWMTLLSAARAQVPATPTWANQEGPGRLPAGASPPLLSAADSVVAQFQAREAMLGELRMLTVHRPLLAVLEDLHWADVSSARLLRHLCDTLHDARLLLVVTRRPGPGSSAALAEAVEALARRSSERIDLQGLDADATAVLLLAATGRVSRPDEVESLRVRSRGNPFFLLELARLRHPGDVPASVGDIVARRLAALPVATQELLRTAAVVGEAFDLQVLAVSAAAPEEEALAALEPAMDSQMIKAERDPDTFSFSHALVRDAVYCSVSPSRRARLHAAVAQALDAAPVRQSRADQLVGAAWHWLAAGPRWAGRAWPAAAVAAAEAVTLHGYEEAATLLEAAVEAADRDPGCSLEQRFDLLLDWLRACVAAGDRVAVQQVVAEAVAQAWRLRDPRRAAVAAVTSADGSLWALRPYGVVDHGMVQTLERALRELPAADERLRCRALLVLAAELYYADSPRERQALVDEGLAMARRLDDPALLAWACLTAPIAIWRPDTAATRHLLADEAVAAARSAGSQTMLTDALTRRAGAALELGRVAEVEPDVAAARRIADRLQLAYPLIALNMMMIPWRAMQDRFDEAESLSQQILALAPRARLQPGEDVAVGAVLPLLMWQGKTQEAMELLPNIDDPLLQVGRRILLWQTGRIDELRDSWERTGSADPPDDWFAVYRLCEAAVTASALGRPSIGAAAYRRLAPYAGTVASAGASSPLGPVDTYLALAAAATGQRATASRHADDALGLCQRWNLPVCARAIRAIRMSGGF
jgi:DNA-binding SARP family transcriptional activator